jgi:Tfp pilus assembly major pilin PilA
VACVFLSYFFMSIMFPTIFALGIFGLGVRAKKASSYIVMAIMGIMSILAGPSYQTLTTRVQARSATIEIASELRLARQLAMARRERLRVIFDRERRTITVRRADPRHSARLSVCGQGVVVESQPPAPNFYFIPAVGR